jgi:hypothetical protein
MPAYVPRDLGGRLYTSDQQQQKKKTTTQTKETITAASVQLWPVAAAESP